MDYTNRSLDELKNGYVLTDEGAYVCSACGQAFAQGEIFPVEGRFFDARRAADAHVNGVHGGSFAMLLGDEGKYNVLTEKQRTLLAHFAAGRSDGEIAKELGLSPSTVRHQKFVFREKAKQAKAYLALYELAFDRQRGGEGGEALIPIPDAAKSVDERFVITEKEREQVYKNNFLSLNPLRLKNFPVKEKKKVVILVEIAGQFEAGKRYTEKEVNALLGEIFPEDHVTLRRYLIEYGFMDRTTDGSAYWLR